MNRTHLFSFALLSGLLFIACTTTSTTPAPKTINLSDATIISEPQGVHRPVSHFRDIPYPDFQYTPPHPSTYRVALSDSITAYLVPDRHLPLVKISFYFRESALPSQPSEAATLELLSAMYRRGGTQKLSAAVVDDSLEFLSAGLGGGLGNHYSSISLNCLSRDLPAVTGILSQMFLEPGMDSLRLELQKASTLQAYAHRFDQPAAQLSALSKKITYQSHPSLWDPLPTEIAAVTRPTLLSQAPHYFRPGRVFISASGDFNPDSMATTLKTLFAQWKPAPQQPAPVPPPLLFRNQPGVYISPKNISQANIVMSQPFVQRPHPDYYPAMVASYILGGSGFTSRLTTRVRSDEGLAYSIYSFTESSYTEVGTAGVALQTKVASVPFALSIIRTEIQKLATEGPRAEELAGAKKALIQSLPGMFDTPEATADAFARSEMWGRHPDHFVEFPQKIQAVTAQQVQEMVAKYFNPAKMTLAIVGPVDKLLQRDSVNQVSLSDFGTIHTIPVDSLLFR